MGRRIYSDERKKEVTDDWLKNPRSITAVAADHGLKLGTITSWIEDICNKTYTPRK